MVGQPTRIVHLHRLPWLGNSTRAGLEDFVFEARSGSDHFGSGGFLGVGMGNSIQKEFFLPDAHGDFIFSIIGEEYGFIGAAAVVALFTLIMFRGYRVSKLINDDFGKYVAFGITTIISAYAVVNISVACGIIPTTGVPVPFISYGGTALIFNSIAIGILLNISSYRNETAEMISARNVNK